MKTALPHLDELKARDVATLVQSAAWPSVTVVLDTTPASTMTTDDAMRLTRLVDEAEHQLQANGALGAGQLRSHLRSLVQQCRQRPTGQGLVILVSQAVQRSYRLPDPVEPRVVVERTFRTRDLLHSLHRTPPHLLLLLRSTCAQLYRVHADTLTPVTQHGFPVQLSAPQPDALHHQDQVGAGFIRTVDKQLSQARRHHPSPLILAGDPDPVAELVRRSRHLDRLAGVLTGPETLEPAALYVAAKASLEEYLRSRQDEALLILEEAQQRRPETVYAGIEQCWQMARRSNPLMLVVESSLQASGPEPGAVDGTRSDLVDDLIEVVIDRGGWVAFADERQLASYAGVALVTTDQTT